MPADPADLYKGREASWVKHLILRRYLEKLAYKMGMWCQTINYVEGFAGPWQPADVELSDTSPHIARKELNKASVGLQRVGRSPHMRALFVEKDTGAAEALRASLEESADATFIRGQFLQVIPEILEFIDAPDVRDPRFTFFFVDPTGWTGFDPEEIASLLQAGRTEVLINFMTKDIIRFIDSSDEKTRQSFVRLFGSDAAWKAWQNRSGGDREDAIVQAFCQRLKEVGKFRHVVSAVVLHPTKDRTHFHLIYGTREDEGLRTFRQAERGSSRAGGHPDCSPAAGQNREDGTKGVVRGA
jgi:three-Cys-motif partner protein